jgi:hypothetical protein
MTTVFEESEYSRTSCYLRGKYENGEINTNIPYVAYGEFYFQGDEAEEVIKEIWTIWNKNPNLTTEEAFNQWANNYL